MKKYYTIHEQIILIIDDEKKQAEIEAYMSKYKIGNKISQNEPKAKVILEFFVFLFIINTIIGIINWNLKDLMMGYTGIGILWLLTTVYVSTFKYNIKEI